MESSPACSDVGCKEPLASMEVSSVSVYNHRAWWQADRMSVLTGSSAAARVRRVCGHHLAGLDSCYRSARRGLEALPSG